MQSEQCGPSHTFPAFSSASFVYGLTLAWGAEESKLALGDPIQLPQTVYRLSMWLYPNWKRQKSIQRRICVLKKAEASWLNLFMSEFERRLSQSWTRLQDFTYNSWQNRIMCLCKDTRTRTKGDQIPAVGYLTQVPHVGLLFEQVN